jgi:hypothetical protein
MLAKCANPACSTPLIYLREGKIFMMENNMENAVRPQIRPHGPILAKPQSANRVEHFWLCGPCSMDMTLTYDRERGVTVATKPRKRAAAAS